MMQLRFDEASDQDFGRTYTVLEEFVAESRPLADGSKDEGQFRIPLASFGIWSDALPFQAWIGKRGSPVSRKTVFDLASLTKILATAPVFARLVDRGWLDWEMPIQARLPTYPHAGITMSHLLSHTSGLPAWAPFWQKLLERAGGTAEKLRAVSIETRQGWLKDEVFAMKPEARPGERVLYSDLSFLLLGWAIEETLGCPLDEAARKELWLPMGIENFHYNRIEKNRNGTETATETTNRGNYAATEKCPWRKTVLKGEVHDDNTWSAGGVAGHAGMFGDVESVVRFAAVLSHERVLSKESRQKMWSRPDQPVGCTRTRGWDLRSASEPATGKFFSAETVGHLGFTGTSLWIDRGLGPHRDLAVVLLTNRVHPHRENSAIRKLRPAFHDAIRADFRHAFGLG